MPRTYRPQVPRLRQKMPTVCTQTQQALPADRGGRPGAACRALDSVSRSRRVSVARTPAICKYPRDRRNNKERPRGRSKLQTAEEEKRSHSGHQPAYQRPDGAVLVDGLPRAAASAWLTRNAGMPRNFRVTFCQLPRVALACRVWPNACKPLLLRRDRAIPQRATGSGNRRRAFRSRRGPSRRPGRSDAPASARRGGGSGRVRRK